MIERPRAASLTVIALCAGVLLGGCGTPSVLYSEAETSDYHTIKRGDIVFGLRQSDVLIVDSKAVDPEDSTKRKRCRSGKSPQPWEWWDCLDTITVQITPSIDKSHVYVARHAESLTWLWETKLSAVALNDERANLQAVSVSYSDNSTQVITSVGSGAVAGLAFGPVGAAAGAAFALVGATASGPKKLAAELHASGRPKQIDTRWMSLVCNDPLVTGMTLAESVAQPARAMEAKKGYLGNDADAVELTGAITPFVLSLSADPGCWHALPIAQSADPRPSDARRRFSGWLYKLELEKQPLGSSTLDEVTGAGYFNKVAQRTFPYVPCQGGKLSFTWVGELADNGFAGDLRSRWYPINVANPAYLRFAELPKNGTITLGANCNAQVSFGPYAGSTAQSDIDALLKQVSAIKAAQGK